MTWKPDICIYHFPCDDGFASAWCVWKKWGDDVEMRPANYGQALPLDEEIAGKNVLIADFSFKYDDLCAMSWKAKSIVLLDHHKTARADLERLPPLVHLTPEGLDDAFKINWSQNTPEIVAHFDMNRSGASLTWEFCFPGEPMPALIKYVEDRDLWRMNYEETRPLSLYLRAHDYDFAAWDEIMLQFENEDRRADILNEAFAIQKFYDKKVGEIADTVSMKQIGEHDGVPVVHAPYAFASDTAHELLQRHADAPFAAVVVDAYGGRTYSLRSEDERVDVSEVAKSFGGGGHRNAAGFRMPL